jgi:hypothetical protein
VLLLLLVMPAALLLMICMLGRYERLIDAPDNRRNDAALAASAVEVAREAVADLTPELAPEAA